MTFTTQQYRGAVDLLITDTYWLRRYSNGSSDSNTYGKRRTLIGSRLGYPGCHMNVPEWSMHHTVEDRDQIRRYLDAYQGLPQTEENKYMHIPDALPSPAAAFARTLHEVAITLENDRDFYNVYIRRDKHSGMRRDDIARACRRLKLDTPHGAFYEQLRRYFDDTWDVKTETAGDTASYAKDPTIRFWVDSVRYPVQPRVEKSAFNTVCSTVSMLPIPKEIPMSKPQVIKVEARTYINGVEAKEYTNAQIFDLIASQEASVAELGKIKAKPKALVKEIAEREAGIATLVAYLDSKEA